MSSLPTYLHVEKEYWREMLQNFENGSNMFKKLLILRITEDSPCDAWGLRSSQSVLSLRW